MSDEQRFDEYPKAHYDLEPASTEREDGVVYVNRFVVDGEAYGSHHSTEAQAVAEALDLAAELLGESTAAWLARYDGWVVDPGNWAEAVHEQFATDDRASFHDVAIRELLYA
jgi:hypothetical protein